MELTPGTRQGTDPLEGEAVFHSRRDCLKLSLLAGAGSLLTGCSIVGRRLAHLEDKGYKPTVPTTEEERALNRLGFGPNAASLADYRTIGRRAYTDKALAGNEKESLGLQLQLQRLDVLQLAPSDLWDIPFDVVLSQLQQAAIVQAAYGKNQLRERMVDFWSNHFNIYARKGNTAYSKGVEETQIVRQNALGNFPSMLRAMAHSPCMLEFLDNQTNKKGVANENYARELMELHTLGLHGGYTQKDVQEVARCFTGWTIENRFLRPKGRFRFDEDAHDDGQKIVLGHVIPPGGGEADGEMVLDLVSRHPSTARFVGAKLSRYFLGREDEKAISSVAGTYLTTDGHIPSMLRHLVQGNVLFDSEPVLKRPFDFMVSALRITQADTDGARGIQTHLERMGEPLYQWPMPDGYPIKTSSWTSSLLPRWNFAIALTHGQIGGTSCRDDALEVLSFSQPPQYGAALALASPEFQWR